MPTRAFWAVLFLATLAVSLPAQAQPADTAEIRHILDNQVTAWNKGDLDGFMAGYWKSPELSFFSNATVTHGWQPTLDRYKKRYGTSPASMGHLTFPSIEITSLGTDAAVVRGQWHLEMQDGKQPHGVFTLVLRKLPEGWRIVHDHSSGE